MSISIGIYDLFAYTIPGLFYLYVVYEWLSRLGIIHFNFTDIPDLSSGAGLLIAIFLAVIAHLAGQFFDYFARLFVFRLLRPRKISEVSLQKIKERHHNLDIQFEARDWSLLFTLLRQRQQDVSRTIDGFEANSIMLRNICLGLFLLALLQVLELRDNTTQENLFILLSIALLCLVTLARSHMFHRWFMNGIFEASLNYGNSLEEVVAFQKAKDVQTSKVSQKVKSRRKTS